MSITVTHIGREHRFTFAESGLDEDSEIGPFRVPKDGRITYSLVALVSGTGSTVDPAWLRASGATVGDKDTVASDSSLAPVATVAEAVVVPYRSKGGALWLQPGINNATSDHLVTGELVVVAGHDR